MESERTSWRMILGAAAGDRSQQRRFATRYEGLIRGVLSRRWHASACRGQLEDACQEVFVECFRADGVLDRMQRKQPARFRSYLFGVIRNVARAHEARRDRSPVQESMELMAVPERSGEGDNLLDWFEREWARTVVRDALDLMGQDAHESTCETARMAELLNLRFRDGLPIRTIARHWNEEPVRVQREYARARRRFHECLREAIAMHESLSSAEVESECRRLTALLG